MRLTRFKSLFQRVKVKFLKQSNLALDQIKQKRDTRLSVARADLRKAERQKAQIQVRVQSLRSKAQSRRALLDQRRRDELRRQAQALLKRVFAEADQQVADVQAKYWRRLTPESLPGASKRTACAGSQTKLAASWAC